MKFKIKNTLIALVIFIALTGIWGCSQNGETVAKSTVSQEDLEKVELPSPFERPVEGSATNTQAPPKLEGSGSDVKDHPNVEEQKKIERGVIVPDAIKDKWKAVKIMVRNKKDESLNEIKTVTLGSSFEIKEGGLKVTVGEFMPNFVMTRTSYTSMNNQLINPAVQLLVEENGKILYKGWSFANYPNLYAFEHEKIAFQLMDYVPQEVS